MYDSLVPQAKTVYSDVFKYVCQYFDIDQETKDDANNFVHAKNLVFAKMPQQNDSVSCGSYSIMVMLELLNDRIIPESSKNNWKQRAKVIRRPILEFFVDLKRHTGPTVQKARRKAQKKSRSTNRFASGSRRANG